MTTPSIQTTILRNLLSNDSYTRKVIPFLKKDYFEGIHRSIFEEVVSFVGKYNNLPNVEALSIELQNGDITEHQYSDASVVLNELNKIEDVNEEWLYEHTEKWCQDRAIYLAIMESITIIDGSHESLSKNSLPDLLQQALAVTFDASVGHDYFENAQDRYEFYHQKEVRTPFDLDYFNRITKGGLPNKTLNVILASTGVGKSLFMCHMAAASLAQQKNVLYITMEMAEERIAERIDANLFNIPLDQITNLSSDMYMTKVDKLQAKTNGKLIIKEYPTGAAHAGHFRALLDELKLKKNFVPSIIFIDYLNICSSSRMKGIGGSINSYTLVKSIAEELRGLAVENNLPVVTATQSNRDGANNSDVDLTNTSESWGLPATADFMFALITNDELEKLNQIMVKQLKNRYADLSTYKRFVIGVDRPKMKLYDVEDAAQTLIESTPTTNDAPINSFGNRDKPEFTNFKM